MGFGQGWGAAVRRVRGGARSSARAEQAGDGARASVAAVGFRVRAQEARGGLKGEAGDLGGRARGRPARIAAGRCAAGDTGKKKGRRRRGADRWGQVVRGRERESAGWERRWACASWAERGGRKREAGRGKRKERPGCCWASWAGLGFFLFFWFPFPFLFQTNSNLFELKSTLNSNSYALNQIKFMHQHECAIMLN
jgi:hypothetical protein